MVKFYTQTYTYDYPFPAVTLAYFLRYPNPYSTHVLSTDTISRHYDSATQRLTTLRLHLKRSKLPSAVLKIIPKSLMGASAGGDTQSYILERSIVDVREGWMKTESKNLEWTGVLSVVERQEFRRPDAGGFEEVFEQKSIETEPKKRFWENWTGFEGAARRRGNVMSQTMPTTTTSDTDPTTAEKQETTSVLTTITLHSSLGSHFKRKQSPPTPSPSQESQYPIPTEDPEPEPKQSFLKSWSTASIQRSIELIGLKRARRSQPNAKEGMKVVLERMREGGLVAVLEGMRRDREMILGGGTAHAGRWRKGGDDEE